MDKSKKIQVTLTPGVYEIIEELREKVYKTNSDSKVISSIVEQYLAEKGYLKAKLEKV